MQRRSFIITAALVTGLGLGIIFGPTVRGLPAGAQTQPPAQTQPTTPGNTFKNLFLDKLAAALNIQRPALDTAIAGAATSTVDEAVAQGQLTQAQADQLKARIQSGDLGALWGGRGGRGGGPRLGGVQQAMFDAAAQALSITADELKTQLRGGQALAQLAQAHGTSEQAVVDAALAAAKTRLDQAVTAGAVTRAQADDMYARLQQAGAQILNHAGRGRHGRDVTPAAPAAPQAPAATPGI